MEFVNHYSAPIVWVLLIVGGASLVWRRGAKVHRWVLLAVVLAGITAGWWVYRPVAKLRETDAKEPLLLEIQSPYCLACLAQKSAVDQIERELEGKLVVRRVDIQSDQGARLSAKYGIAWTPSFIFFGEDGAEQWRMEGKIDAARVRGSLRVTK